MLWFLLGISSSPVFCTLWYFRIYPTLLKWWRKYGREGGYTQLHRRWMTTKNLSRWMHSWLWSASSCKWLPWLTLRLKLGIYKIQASPKVTLFWNLFSTSSIFVLQSTDAFVQLMSWLWRWKNLSKLLSNCALSSICSFSISFGRFLCTFQSWNTFILNPIYKTVAVIPVFVAFILHD